MQLPKRPLGRTGITVSPLGLGTVKFGRNKGLKYPAPFELPNDETLLELLAIGRELGINLIDTAPAYGLSEERLGKLLKTSRDEFILSTKTGEEFHHDDHHPDGISQFFFDRKHTRMSVERSLKRLNTDYLDVVLVHSNGEDLDVIHNTDALETLDSLKDAGLIRTYGISTKTPEGGLAAASLVDVVMVTLNPHHLDELSVIERCSEKNTGVLLKKVLGSGHICHDDAQNNARDNTFALALNQAGVSSAIIGTINPEHLRDNVAAALTALVGNTHE